jgi:hypothetical protein
MHRSIFSLIDSFVTKLLELLIEEGIFYSQLNVNPFCESASQQTNDQKISVTGELLISEIIHLNHQQTFYRSRLSQHRISLPNKPEDSGVYKIGYHTATGNVEFLLDKSEYNRLTQWLNMH